MKKLAAIALLAAMLLSCFAGCAMQKGEIVVADEANVEEVAGAGETVIGIKDDLRANVEAAKKGDLTSDTWDDGTTVETAWFTNEEIAAKKAYELKTAEELMGFRSLLTENTFEGWTITLAANIDLNKAELDGISTQFAGTFNGKDHVISNYTMNLAASTGFFGNVQGTEGQAAFVQNVAFVNVTCNANAGNVGSVAGNVKGYANIVNVYSNAIMEAGASVTKVGGLFGSVTTGNQTKNITNCEFGGTINSTNTGDVYLGGIAAAVNGGIVTFSYCAVAEGAKVNGAGKAVGGILGYCNSQQTVTVTHCVNNAAVAGANSVGGLVGQFRDKNDNGEYVVEYSTNNGTVTGGEGGYTGGIIGVYTQAKKLTVTGCTNNGAVTGKTITGGILGGIYNSNYEVSIESSANNANVTGTEEVGGVVGHANDKLTVKNCKNAASIRGTSGFGSIVGLTTDSTTIQDCTHLVMVGYQTTKVEGGKYDLRFVVAFDDDKAAAAGFVVTAYYKDAQGKKLKIDNETVYAEKVYTSIKGTSANGKVSTYTASDFGGKYFYTLVIKGVPAEYTIADGTLDVLITPFTAVEAEGKVVKTEYRTEQYPLNKRDELSNYVIVYKKGSTALKKAAETFQKYVKESYGVELPVVDDSTPETVYEFLIGNVNRSLATEYLQKEEAKNPVAYVTAVKNKKLLFATQNDAIIERSIESFCKKYVASKDSFLLQMPVSFEEFNSAFDFADSTELAEGANLRVMSFNILSELFNSQAVIEGRQLPVMAPIFTYMPDILGMQEVSDAWYIELDKLFGDTYAIADRTHSNGVTNVCPLVYNTKTLKLVAHGTSPLPEVGTGRRTMSWGYFERKSDGARFVAINTHWNPGYDAEDKTDRVTQAQALATLVNTLKTKYKCPVITTGDYNSFLTADAVKTYMANSGLLDACKSAKVVNRAFATAHDLGVNTPTAGKAIDHIFASSDVELLYYNVLIDEFLVHASDHYPIYADIKLNK